MQAFLIQRGKAIDIYALGPKEGEVIFRIEYFNGLDRSMKLKIAARIEFLADTQPPIKNTSISRKLTKNIFELKAKKARLLYFYYIGDRAVITHAFQKQGQKTPKKEIDRAEQLRKLFLSL